MSSVINIPLLLCGIFYSVLCIFSIVTGIIYMSGKRELNPLELSDKFMEKLSDPEKLLKFTKKMGCVTFIVGIAQGITAFCIFRCANSVLWWFALGFTVFSIASVAYKLKGKRNAFPLLKSIAYISIFVVLIMYRGGTIM